MAKRKQQQSSLPIVDAATASTFDEFVAASAAMKPLSQEEKKKKAAQKKLEAKFDELGVDRFALPDGRIVQREAGGRDMAAKEAHRQTWWKIFQAAA